MENENATLNKSQYKINPKINLLLERNLCESVGTTQILYNTHS